jgi:hypothetical protein
MAFFTGSKKWQFNRATSELCGGQGNTVRLTFMMVCGRMLSNRRISCNICSSQTACGCLQGNDIHVGSVETFHSPPPFSHPIRQLLITFPAEGAVLNFLLQGKGMWSHSKDWCFTSGGKLWIQVLPHHASWKEVTPIHLAPQKQLTTHLLWNKPRRDFCIPIAVLIVPSQLLSCSHNSL